MGPTSSGPWGGRTAGTCSSAGPVPHLFCLLSRCIWIRWTSPLDSRISHVSLIPLELQRGERSLGYLRGFGSPISRQLHLNLLSPFLPLYLAPVVFLYRLTPSSRDNNHSGLRYSFVSPFYYRCCSLGFEDNLLSQRHLHQSGAFFHQLSHLPLWSIYTSYASLPDIHCSDSSLLCSIDVSAVPYVLCGWMEPDYSVCS
ncbi:hypothetical protein F2Q69_00019789 [Brassica cretica]|uniref:Uncharacterized protein n=1 Tax=Brassica cretica TaxID=69181 RepID=A0A8S9Q9S4_BRACR|nr:hypothetical protein F2Q69_00019789 [Brassica cretica]